VPRCRHRSPPQPTLAADRGVADASTDDIYAAMDWLADQQDDIEAKLARRHLAPEPNPARMELFDLSSSWLEGTRCPLAGRGYSRDGKKGGPQIEWSGGRRTPGRGARGSGPGCRGFEVPVQQLIDYVRRLGRNNRGRRGC
jgi:hypothetical protein